MRRERRVPSRFRRDRVPIRPQSASAPIQIHPNPGPDPARLALKRFDTLKTLWQLAACLLPFCPRDPRMAKPEWGVKRACPSCGARFYDLMRDPIVCPACGESFALEALTRPRRGKAAAAPKPVKAPEPALEEVEDAEDLVETDDDAVLDLDDDDDGASPPVAASGDEEGGDASIASFPDDEEDDVPVDDDGDDAVLDDEEDEVSLDALGEAEVDDDEDKDRD